MWHVTRGKLNNRKCMYDFDNDKIKIKKTKTKLVRSFLQVIIVRRNVPGKFALSLQWKRASFTPIREICLQRRWLWKNTIECQWLFGICVVVKPINPKFNLNNRNLHEILQILSHIEANLFANHRNEIECYVALKTSCSIHYIIFTRNICQIFQSNQIRDLH